MNKILLATVVSVSFCAVKATPVNDAHDQIAKIVSEIQRADYEGDRAGMRRGYDALKAFLEDGELASRVRYWRGFALWRRAINGFNDKVDLKELEQDLKTALDEFKAAMDKDPQFV